jgi:hypothetical protein
MHRPTLSPSKQWISLFALVISFFLWSNPMQNDSSEKLETFEWQAAAGRAPTSTISAKLHGIERVNTGVFGVLKSPSINIPMTDPVWATFSLTEANGARKEPLQQIKFKLIQSQLGTTYPGDPVLLDMIGGNICIGLRAGAKAK